MLNHLASMAGYVSLHSAVPASAANELSGGGYERQPVTWNSASGGAITAASKPEFMIPAGATIAAVGFWSAETGGVLYAYADVSDPQPETYVNAGRYLVEQSALDLNKG